MSSYATLSDLYSLAIPQGATAAISAAAQQLALDSASDFADSYLSARYVLPLVHFGNDIKRAVCHIAAFDVLCGRGFNPGNPAHLAFKERQQDAQRWFRDISNEKATPAGAVDSSPAAGTADSGLPSVSQVHVAGRGRGLSLGGEMESEVDCVPFLEVGPPQLRGW